MRTSSASAHARAALAGNPSDGYGGAVLAVAVHDFGAEVEVADVARVAAAARPRSGAAPVAEAASPTIDPPSELVAAAVRRFAPDTAGVAIRWRCSVPREVGLAGSSAIVVATLRALAAFHDRPIAVADLPELALAVETDLGIAAGLQDRVAQAYDTLVFMDFGGDRPRYEPLDPALLPPLYLAWREDAAEGSGIVHADLRARHARDAATQAAMRRLADHARAARAALLAGDHDAFGRALDRSFDERAAMIPLDPRHVRMVEVARAHRATANYAGSGGAVVGTAPDAATLEGALRAEGCTVIAPRVPARPPASPG